MRRRSWIAPSLSLACVILAAGFCLRQSHDQPATVPQPPASREIVVPVAETGSWLEPRPERTRIVFLPEGVQGGSRDSEQLRANAVLSVDHQGCLVGADLEALIREVLDYRGLRDRMLTEYSAKVDSKDAMQVKEEAALLAAWEIAVAAEHAVRQGSYLTVNPPEVVMSIPGCEVLATSAPKAGKRVNVVVVMPHNKYPRLAQAREYQQLTDEAAARMLAYAFNGKSDQERRDLVAKRDEILANRSRGSALTAQDLDFLHNTMGFALPIVINPTSNMMYLRDR